MSDSEKLGRTLAVVEAKRYMAEDDATVVTRAMSTRMHQLEKELARHGLTDPASWIDLVVATSYKVLGLEREPMPKKLYPYIECGTCHLKSYNENDINNRFCGNCDKFHEVPSDYVIGNVFEEPTKVAAVEAETGFTWSDETGAMWACPRPVEEHEPVQCASCVPITDDSIDTADVVRANTPANMLLMAAACRQHLDMEERAEVHEAISKHTGALISKLLPHGGRIISPLDWAQLVLKLARETIEEDRLSKIIDNTILQEVEQMTHTYTLAKLEISETAYREIRQLLESAGYDHAIDRETGRIDMTGLALLPAHRPEELVAANDSEAVERAMQTAQGAELAINPEEFMKP